MLQGLLSKISSFIFAVLGWSVEGEFPQQQTVIIVAPHTSNWDFVYFLGLAFYWKIVGRVLWIGKHSLFVGVFGTFLKKIGGIPVDRRNTNNLVMYIASYLKKHPGQSFALAPEGTRSFRDHWKRGFMLIAKAADCPISFAFIDYPNKRIGMGPQIDPNLSEAEQWEEINAFYQKSWAYKPQQFSDMKSPPSRKKS